MKHRKLAAALTAAVSVCSLIGAMPLTVHAQNPFVQTTFAPDPAPVVFGDTLYCFTGCDKDGSTDFYHMTGWQCFSTTDMQNWTNHGTFMNWDDFSWGKQDSAWASQCIERNGKYYFYVTLETNGGRAIGVAVADKPEGPYKDAIGKPLCGPDWAYIDPTVMIDDDGQAYLMFGNPTCYYVKLNEDMISLGSEIKHFDMTEAAFGPCNKDDRPTSYGEGPWIYKRGDLYYLVYASFYASEGGESMSYSTGPSVTGPWTYRGQIMKPHNCFTTHGGIVDYKDHSYFFYHKVGLQGGGTFMRSACVEEFQYNPDGSIPNISPTDSGPSQIEAFNPYRRVEAETYSWSEGIEVEPIKVGTQAIGFIQNGDYVKISGVDFGEVGAREFLASVSSNGQGGKIELHLDDVTGPIIGTVDCPVTGDWQKWTTVTTEVTGATGQHDLYLRFSGGDSYLFNVDYWKFTRSDAAPFILGDVDEDGAITAKDLSLAKLLLITESTDTLRIKAADVNQNGKMEVADIVWYAKYICGDTTEYPEKVEPEIIEPVSNFTYNPAVTIHEFPEKYTDPADVQGQVIEEHYNGINGNKTMYVYLPPNYDENKKYNVFYLMHGGGENEKTVFFDKWTQFPNIFDHMIANGELDPLIVVAPTFNGSPDGAGDIWNEVRQSIVPYVEGKYSTYAKSTSPDDLKASRFHRAYGGFSMGGGSTWNVLINDLDYFAYFMPLSGHCWGGASAITNAIDKFGYGPRDYFVFAATGSEDIAHGNMVPLINSLKNDSHFVYTSDFSQGNLYFLDAPDRTHWWGYVRHYVYDALPYFFHEGQ